VIHKQDLHFDTSKVNFIVRQYIGNHASSNSRGHLIRPVNQKPLR